jgi:ArsR family transcriptional regulator
MKSMSAKGSHPSSVAIQEAGVELPFFRGSEGEQELAALCKALAHPARVRILKILIEKKFCVCGEIVEVMPLAQSTVSEHLRILKQAGLVQGEVDGPRVCYCIHPGILGRFKALVEAL